MTTQSSPPADRTAGNAPRRSARPWLIGVAGIAVVAAGAALALTLGDDEPSGPPTSTASPSSEGSPVSPADPTDGSDDPTPAPEPDEPAGTPSDPFPAGHRVTAGGWVTVIGPTDVDAWPEISADLNDHERGLYAPPAGTAYVAAPMTVTYEDGTPANLGSYDVTYVSAAGASYTPLGTCRAALKEKRIRLSEVYTSPEVSGTLCVDVPVAEAAGGTWHLYLRVYDDASNSTSQTFEGHVSTE